MTDWKRHGGGLRAITRELNRLNIRTLHGNQWYASTVSAQLSGKTVFIEAVS